MASSPAADRRSNARWLANLSTYEADLLADDEVFETPLAALGRPTRTDGKRRVLEYR